MISKWLQITDSQACLETKQEYWVADSTKMTALHFFTSCVTALALLCVVVGGVEDTHSLGHSQLDGWDFAHATFYGDMSGAETMLKLHIYTVWL